LAIVAYAIDFIRLNGDLDILLLVAFGVSIRSLLSICYQSQVDLLDLHYMPFRRYGSLRLCVYQQPTSPGSLPGGTMQSSNVPSPPPPSPSPSPVGPESSPGLVPPKVPP
jgi:hypothetical protein